MIFTVIVGTVTAGQYYQGYPGASAAIAGRNSHRTTVYRNNKPTPPVSCRTALAQQALVVVPLLQAELQGTATVDDLQGHLYLATEPHAAKQLVGRFITRTIWRPMCNPFMGRYFSVVVG